MAFPLYWPADVWLQAVICAGFVGLTLLLVRIDLLRTAVLSTGGAILNGSRLIAGGVIWLFDRIMPVDGRSGRLPRFNFAIWILLNAAVVAAWVIVGEADPRSGYALLTSASAATFAALNLLLLGASYWAIRETIEVTNGERAAAEARFAEASPARSVIFVLGTATLLIAQIAVVVEWVQQYRAVPLVDSDGLIAPGYLNFLLATIDALPLAAIYVAPLAGHAWFSADLPGLILNRSLNGLGSILIVGTALGLLQQRLAFQRMVDGLVNGKDARFPEALLARFKNAPSAIKGYVTSAFQSEIDDTRRLRLARLAVAHESFSFPATFVAGYPRFSDRVRDEGCSIVAGFVEDAGAGFSAPPLQKFFDVCDYTQHHGGFKTADDRRLIARIYIPALERVAALDAKPADDRIRTIFAQKILVAALQSRDNMALGERAARLLVRVSSYEAIAPLLKALDWFTDATALLVLSRIIRILGDRGIVFPPARNLELLKRMAVAGRTARRAMLSPEAAASLEKAMEKLEARLTAASATIEKQKQKRERAAARRPRAQAKPQLPVVASSVVANAAVATEAAQL